MMAPDATTRILQARAQALARPPVAALVEPMLEVVVFHLADEAYAIEATFLREVQPLKDLTPLPGTPTFLRGIINIRGRIVAVIDLKKFFDLPEAGIHDLHQVLIVHTPALELGILADRVVGCRSVPESALQSALPTMTGIRADYLKGVTAERLIVLDAVRLLADPRISVQDEP